MSEISILIDAKNVTRQTSLALSEFRRGGVILIAIANIIEIVG